MCLLHIDDSLLLFLPPFPYKNNLKKKSHIEVELFLEKIVGRNLTLGDNHMMEVILNCFASISTLSLGSTCLMNPYNPVLTGWGHRLRPIPDTNN